ncbi:MAG: glycosyltransferase [Pseudomonadota bacterium]
MKISESDWARVHFLGRISYGRFVNLLQISSVHVYLTYPFVLSWSLMEAMACGTAIVASDTAPVREMIPDGQFGRLVDFFDRDALVDEVYDLLEDPEARAELGETTRQSMVKHYDLKTVCLPQQLSWVSQVMASA